jgi:proline iminopeptidase
MTVNSFTNVPDNKKKLRKIKVPVLILRGQCDNQKWGYITEYLSLIRNVQLKIVPGAGHSIALEQPELYHQYIKEFLMSPVTTDTNKL